MMTSYFLGSSIRTPATFTNSAVILSTAMELIFSTSAGGKVFSIPNTIPIFLFMTKTPHVASASGRLCRMGLSPQHPIKILEVFAHHFSPERPIMTRVISPNIQPMWHALAIQQVRHPHILVQAHIPLTRSQHYFHLSIAAQEPVVGHIPQKIRRAIEVTIVIVIS